MTGRSEEDSGPILIVGLGNPGPRYEGTRHNVGFEVVRDLGEKWDLGRTREKFNGIVAEGRTEPGGPRVILFQPLTFMNESGRAAGPLRGSKRIPLDRVVVIHDEIDLPFGEVRSRLGGGLAGHNGLKSLKSGFGDDRFWRVRVGVGRPDSTDPEVVSAWVLGRFSEPEDDVRALVGDAVAETGRLVSDLAAGRADDETGTTT
jgi:PTH1 family peptidyl-tRNA hydrolase